MPPLSDFLLSRIFIHLPLGDLLSASSVCEAWRAIIDSNAILWENMLKSASLWVGGSSERAFKEHIYAERRHQSNPTDSSTSSSPHPYKTLLKSRYLNRNRWLHNPVYSHISFPAHGSSVVTCMLISHGKIFTASDDSTIQMFSLTTGQLIRSLEGHEGGVWSIAATQSMLVSGSSDRTVRIWNLETGRCTHIFGGHTSTVRCVDIVKPEIIDVMGPDGIRRKEKWPKRPLIVTGSRDHSVRIWSLPSASHTEYLVSDADKVNCNAQPPSLFWTQQFDVG